MCFMNEAWYICFAFGSLLLPLTLCLFSLYFLVMLCFWRKLRIITLSPLFFVCLLSLYGQFPVVGSDQLNSLSCDYISWPNIPLQHSKSPKCVLFKKKKKKCTVNRGELPLRALFNRVASESLSWGESLISRQVLF